MNAMTLRRVGAAAAWLMVSAAAVTDAREPSSMPDATSWRSECGSCHVPYPPRLLTAGDWRTLMSRLDRHYGQDASVDAALTAEIARYLEAHAGNRAGGRDDGLPRITTGRWFEKEHREVPPATWSTSSVKTRANCAACHPGAAQGDFDEHDVRIPTLKGRP